MRATAFYGPPHEGSNKGRRLPVSRLAVCCRIREAPTRERGQPSEAPMLAALALLAFTQALGPAASSPPASAPAAKAPVVVLETSLGRIRIGLDPAKSPATVENFLSYVRAGHYDGTVFHRVD